MNSKNITCPNCQYKLDINHVLKEQIEDQLKQDYSEKLKSLKEQQSKAEQQVEHEVITRLKKERLTQEQHIKTQLNEKMQEQVKAMKSDLQQQNEELKEYHKQRAEFAKLKREKDQLEVKLKADSEILLNQQLKQERKKITQQIEETNQFKIEELKKQLLDQKNLTQEMQRKQNQGSMQLQGEIQELEIEKWLKKQFPFDQIEEIKKGEKGGDCIQIINTASQQQAGSIYYESKRTKSFQPGWIEKFKKDMQEKNVDIGVLVTQSLPKDWKRLGQIKGVWVCSFDELKGLSQVLRESILQVFQSKAAQENKGDKMVSLYDYMTSNSFKMQIQSIVEGFSQLKEDLEKEKRAMQRIWKSREMQLEKVLTNTIDMYGSVKGLAGPSVESIEALDFPE